MKERNVIREKNLSLIRELLRKNRSATKPQLAEISGLSIVTVNALISSLLETNEVFEDGIYQPDIGRPAVIYTYNENYKLILSIVMHEKNKVDNVFFSVCNLYGSIIEHLEQTIKDVCIDSFDTAISCFLHKYPAIQIIGVGMPATEVNGKLIICDYEKLENTCLSQYLSDKHGLPVFIENDINAATYGYCRVNNLLHHQCVIGLYYPVKYTPGAGICMNGEIFRGRNHLAGAIHLLYDSPDWMQFDYSMESLLPNIEKIIDNFIHMLNPDKIVLYMEDADTSFLEKLHQKYFSLLDTIMFPEIDILDVTNQFNEHFERGIIYLALKQLAN